VAPGGPAGGHRRHRDRPLTSPLASSTTWRTGSASPPWDTGAPPPELRDLVEGVDLSAKAPQKANRKATADGVRPRGHRLLLYGFDVLPNLQGARAVTAAELRDRFPHWELQTTTKGRNWLPTTAYRLRRTFKPPETPRS
jgi:hypothetical protein